MRTIFHVDMDAFFVSVEELYDPTLKGKAVVVGGKANERGVCAAASYEARKFGVHSAMPLRTAAKLCPRAIFLEGHPERYREYSEKVRIVLDRFSPQVEMASIDEAYLDMTGTGKLHGPPFQAAHALHADIKRSTGLNSSIGIGSSRLIAKISSEQAKPNGALYVLPGCEREFLAPLDVRKVPGVGKVTEQRLHELGIRTIADLQKLDDDFLEEHFGAWGLALAGKSRGEDAGGWFSKAVPDSEVGAADDPKSISHEHTYSVDIADADQLESTLARLSEMVARRLREHKLHARTIGLKLRYSDFTTITRAHTLDQPTQLDPEIYGVARRLFHDNWKPGSAIRLLGVRAAGFEHSEGQLDLLAQNQQEKWKHALSAVDRVRDKFGEGAVSLARGMKSTFRERTHEALPEKPRPDKPKPPDVKKP
ncbi:MAG: DNA polymerase IV [Acidobacteriota bacterium]|nr:DNA polymerase IV [Acidobacteriota bacterium]